MRTSGHRPAMLAIVVLALVGCGAGGQSTRLRLDDLNQSTSEMAASLAASDFLAQRTAQSPPIYVVIDKVENLTTDLIPPAEQWMFMARLQGSLPMKELTRHKNIHFQITPEQFALLRESGFEDDLTPPPQVTHVMQGVFRAAPRTVRSFKTQQVNLRQDYYLLQYAITDVQSREIVWSDKFEFKRQARGLAID